MKAENLNGWLIDPVTNSVRFLEEELSLANGNVRNIGHVKVAQKISEIFFPLLRNLNTEETNLDDFQQYAQFLEDDAQAAHSRSDDFTRKIFEHAAVGFWNTIDTTVTQTAINHLTQQHIELKTIKQKFPSKSVPCSSTDEAENVIRYMKRKIPDSLNRVQKLCALLSFSKSR